MKRSRHTVLLCLVMLACLAGASLSPAQSRQGAETWARENYRAVLDLVFRQGCPSEEAQNVRWVVCVRIVPGFTTDLEYELSLEKLDDGSVRARIMRPQAQSVYMQLSTLRKQHSNFSPGSLARLIALETASAGQTKLAALLGLADDFEKIGVAPALSDTLMMDATKYEISSRSSSGEHLELVLLGPGSSAPRQSSPMLQWVESLRTALLGMLR